MAFLQQNSPSDALVFTDDWDVFPICYYFNQHNRFIVGLDPQFTATRFPTLWPRYKSITQGQFDGGASLDDIVTIFDCDYVLVLHDHRRFYRALSKRPDRFERVYPIGEIEGQPPATVFRCKEAVAKSDVTRTGRRRGVRCKASGEGAEQKEGEFPSCSRDDERVGAGRFAGDPRQMAHANFFHAATALRELETEFGTDKCTVTLQRKGLYLFPANEFECTVEVTEA